MLQSLESSASLQCLFKKHIQPVLQDFRTSVDTWSLCSPERFIFGAILTHAGTHLITRWVKKLSAFVASSSLSCSQVLELHDSKPTEADHNFYY
jgi:hypothetical protein